MGIIVGFLEIAHVLLIFASVLPLAIFSAYVLCLVGCTVSFFRHAGSGGQALSG